MKVSVSLPDEDVAYLDSDAQQRGIASRSAVLHEAIRLLRASELGSAYEHSWTDWAESDDAELWESLASDGLG